METGATSMSNDFIDTKEIARMLSIKPKSVNYVIQSDERFPKTLLVFFCLELNEVEESKMLKGGLKINLKKYDSTKNAAFNPRRHSLFYYPSLLQHLAAHQAYH